MRNNSINVIDLNNTRKNKPVIVLFFAHGCGWCERMRPEWEKFKKECPINYSEVSSDLMQDYEPSPKETRIMGYPTLRLYNKGKLVKEYDGDRSKKDLLKFVEKYAKNEKVNKNNLLIVRARKTNKLNKKLLKKLSKKQKKKPKKNKVRS